MDTSSAEAVEARFRIAIASSMSIAPDDLDRTQTIVIPEVSRTGSEMASAYHVGSPTLIRTDPALAAELAELIDSEAAIDSRGIVDWAESRGWEFIDGVDLHVMSRACLRPQAMPPDAHLVELDRDSAVDRGLIAALLAESDPDDVDAAEFALDDLDPHILGLLDGSGLLRTLVSGREWDSDRRFDDIGILTAPPRRGEGWGAAAVGAFCDASLSRGRLPLYRCAWSRVASKATALRVGFLAAGRLTAIRRLDQS